MCSQVVNQQVLQLAQLREQHKRKLQKLRDKNKSQNKELGRLGNVVADIKNQLRLANLKCRQSLDKNETLRQTLRDNVAVYNEAFRMKLDNEKVMRKLENEHVAVEKNLKSKLREVNREHKDAQKKLKASKMREKRLSETAVLKKNGKRVPISDLKNVSQKLKRRNEFTRKVATHTLLLAKADKLEDDVTGIAISFADFRDMSVRFVNNDVEVNVEDEPSEEERSTADVSDDGIMKRVHEILATSDVKNISVSSHGAFSSSSNAKTHGIKLEACIDGRNETFNETSNRIGMKCDPSGTKAEVDVNKMLDETKKLRSKLKELATLRLMMCGDGRSVKAKHESMALYMVVLDEGAESYRHAHVHQLGTCSCKEGCESIRDTCAHVLKQLSDLNKNGHDGSKTSFHLGGDVKFILMTTGLHGAGTKKRATCTGCSCTEPHRRKNPTAFRVCANRLMNGKDRKCPTLFPCIPPIRTVVDVLHTPLRLTDTFFNLFVTELLKDHGDKKGISLMEEGMSTVVRGFTFFLRAEKKAGKNSWEAKCGYSLMRGAEKLTSLRNFDRVLMVAHAGDESRRAWLSKVWREPSGMHSILNVDPPQETQAERTARAEALKAKCEAFVKTTNFPAKGVKGRAGYQRGGCTAAQTSTPHCHFACCHAWECIKECGGLRPFNMQGVEFVNNSDGRALATLVSGRKPTVLAELLLHNWRMVLFEQHAPSNKKPRVETCKICERKFSKGKLRCHCKSTHRLDDEETKSHAMRN